MSMGPWADVWAQVWGPVWGASVDATPASEDVPAFTGGGGRGRARRLHYARPAVQPAKAKQQDEDIAILLATLI